MKRPPRRSRGILGELKGSIASISILAFAVSIGLFLFLLKGLRLPVQQVRTAVFTQIVFFELLLAFECRSQTRSAFRFGNPWLLLACLASAALQLCVVYVPFLSSQVRYSRAALASPAPRRARAISG